MRLWWENSHPGWMIFTLGNQHFETLNQIIQYSQSSVIKGGLAPLQVNPPPPLTPDPDSAHCCIVLLAGMYISHIGIAGVEFKTNSVTRFCGIEMLLGYNACHN